MATLQNITGLDALKKALEELPKNIGKNVLRGAVNAASTEFKKEAVARAPSDTGILKKSIYQKQIREKSSATQQTFYIGVRAGKRAKTTKKGQKLDAFYARFVEFGTSKMAAKPFMRPAFEAKKLAAIEKFKEYAAKRIPDEIAKVRK
ncbi:MAG: hypothetical protein H6R01_944 [Burkholderiaceae bacterium]|nr:hypothetical protein [Burkholderiaceae bacterium]